MSKRGWFVDGLDFEWDGNRQKGASIFFSDKFWSEDEWLYKSDNGGLLIVKVLPFEISTILSVF